ncbi:hypothetical protein ACTXT7_013952 [Hymenolepis weldensis]
MDGLVGGRQRTILVKLEVFSDGHMSTSNKTRFGNQNCEALKQYYYEIQWTFATIKCSSWTYLGAIRREAQWDKAGKRSSIRQEFSSSRNDVSIEFSVSFEKGWNLENLRSGSTEGPQSSASQHKVMACVRQGCEVAMATGGPLMRSRVLGVGVHVHCVGQLSSTTSISNDGLTRLQVPMSSQNFASFSALLRSTVIKAVKDALDGLKEWKIIEPVMAVEIQLPLDAAPNGAKFSARLLHFRSHGFEGHHYNPMSRMKKRSKRGIGLRILHQRTPRNAGSEEASLAPFMGELSRRRGEIESVEVVECKGDRGSRDCFLRAFAPLAALSGFSATIRSLSSGRADIALRLAHFRPVSAERQAEILRKAHIRPTRNHDSPV